MNLQLNAFTVFLAIAAVGFLILMISLFFGGIFDHFEGGVDDHGGPGFFSTRVISVFVTAFGAFGAIATHYGLNPLAASTVGFGGGVVLATPVLLFARFLYSQQASSESRAADLVGQTGRVIVTIPAGGVGQVRCRIGEELIDKIARTRQGESIPENTSVRVEEVLGETVIVARQ
ncbi:MAG TPA: NfeD family protein [Vicinamibacterales bacterium]|jgi:membrane protein implicated in regulation of membrane protease activity|nr:NfeD family protein [Vicinamibacterales bacterium]